MYRAKGQGGARHAVFDQAMHERVMARLELETGLRQALEAASLRVLYQPDRDGDGPDHRLRGAVPLDDRTGHAIAPREFIASPRRPG